MSDQLFIPDEPRIHPTSEMKGCRLGRHVVIGERTILRDVVLGDYTYLERHAEMAHTDVGKFCSIASNTRINALEHPVERVTQHKISYRPNEFFRFLGVDQQFRTRRATKRVRIGHDVWIGHGAVVMPGVSIGNGAVVGANAVVTRAVEPYTIVGGVPARQIRRRFPEQIAARIEALAWWDFPRELLYEAIADMQNLSVQSFLDTWERRASNSIPTTAGEPT